MNLSKVVIFLSNPNKYRKIMQINIHLTIIIIEALAFTKALYYEVGGFAVRKRELMNMHDKLYKMNMWVLIINLLS